MEMDGYADAIIAFVREHKAWAGPIVFVLAFGESLAFISLVLPFWAILVGIGTLIGASGGLDFWWILTMAATGAALGDWLSYWLGHHYHEQIARMWPLRNYPDLIPTGHRFFEKWGAWAVVLGRFSGPLRASVPLVAGIVEMPRVKFQIANWLSAFLWAFVLLMFGDFAGQSFNWIRAWWAGS
jgi:membrane protein DedA with SNARE-associated domain